ncbi:MAG: O-antigen ligase family protein, partial [Planctomycetes bacterium]|nr:O-antigen ligase family protein [Planctomycetota bacterium]
GWVAFDFNQRYILMGQKAVASRGFAGIDNNGIAAVMVMGIPFCVLLFSQAKRWYLKLVPMAALVLMAHVVLFSMSRGGMLALLIIIPVLFLRLRRRLIGVALLVLLSLVGFRLAGQEVRKRFMSIQDYESDSSAQIRLTAWRAGLQVIRDYPVFGVGPACFYSISGNYDYNIQNRAMHNLFLQTAVDMGLPAAGVLVAILLFSLWHLQKLRRRHKDDSFICDITNCLQAVLLGYIVTGMFVSIGTLELPYIALAMTVGLRNIVAEGAPSLAVETPQQQKRNTGPFPGRMKPATT